jgi:hypothetical protein
MYHDNSVMPFAVIKEDTPISLAEASVLYTPSHRETFAMYGEQPVVAASMTKGGLAIVAASLA